MATHRKSEMSETWWPTQVAAAVTVLAFPVCFTYSRLCKSLPPAALLLVALCILALVLLMIIKLTHTYVQNSMYYGFALFSFTGIVDMVCALETNGIISGYMSLYLKNAEPYLWSAWGSIAMYWDGTGFVVCYLIMGHCAANGKSYRTVGLHWSSAILNSMIVLVVGACLSESGTTATSLINIIYVVVPLIVGIICINEPQEPRQKQDQQWSWIDILLAILLLQAMVAATVRGVAAFGSEQQIFHWYKNIAEPILMQDSPAPFARIQGLISFFYFAPSFALLAWGLLMCPEKEWFLDLAIVTAGATSQAGVSMVGMSIHSLTEPKHKMPSFANHSAFFTFWIVNILISIVPQLLALRLFGELPEGLKRD